MTTLKEDLVLQGYDEDKAAEYSVAVYDVVKWRLAPAIHAMRADTKASCNHAARPADCEWEAGIVVRHLWEGGFR